MEQSKARNAADVVAARASSFADMYDVHVEETYRFIHRRCRDHSPAEAVTRETFTEAIRSTDDPNSISIGWLLTAARTRLIDVLRRQDRDKGKLRLVGPVTEDVDTIEPATRLRALNELSLDHRLILTLHCMEGLTVPAIADQLDRSAISIEGSVQQAGRRLRATLDEGGST